MYMLHELMYMHMFTNTIVFRDERNVKITSFLSAKTLSKAYCVIVYGRLNIPVSTSELIF